MSHFTILIITTDAGLLRTLRPRFKALGGTRLVVASSMEEATDLLEIVDARLIVAHWEWSFSALEQMDRLLWVNSIAPKPVPVMVLADHYQAEEALTLFQMGVDEYISATHHLDGLDGVLETLLMNRPATAVPFDKAARASARRRKHGRSRPTVQPALMV